MFHTVPTTTTDAAAFALRVSYGIAVIQRSPGCRSGLYQDVSNIGGLGHHCPRSMSLSRFQRQCAT